MGQSNSALGEDKADDPSNLLELQNTVEPEASPRASWLTLALMVAMIASFALVWFLSTPR